MRISRSYLWSTSSRLISQRPLLSTWHSLKTPIFGKYWNRPVSS